mmetsp:Transcript_2766/g.9317  ORF Transcript_2766/g.9317 Transcript_2766/m.9317 type:complete len:394 (+) Transcript_2766:1339-2520(+)
MRPTACAHTSPSELPSTLARSMRSSMQPRIADSCSLDATAVSQARPRVNKAGSSPLRVVLGPSGSSNVMWRSTSSNPVPSMAEAFCRSATLAYSTSCGYDIPAMTVCHSKPAMAWCAPHSRSRSRSASNASTASAMSPNRKRAPPAVVESATRRASTETAGGTESDASLAEEDRPANVSCRAQSTGSSPRMSASASRNSRACQSSCTTTLRKQLNSPRGFEMPAAVDAASLPVACSCMTLASDTAGERAARDSLLSPFEASPLALRSRVKGSSAPLLPSKVCHRLRCRSTISPSRFTSSTSWSASRCKLLRTRLTTCSMTTRTLSSDSEGMGTEAESDGPPSCEEAAMFILSQENGSIAPPRPSVECQRRRCRSTMSPRRFTSSMIWSACGRW